MDKIKKLVKEKLCKKGEAYRKRRMAAGEKSSAYLSGRAVKVCKGQMSGKKKANENTAPNHDGKSAPYGSGYKELNVDKMAESLRDWFKKENWVRINTSGNISGDCGTMKKDKATTRCLPKKKAQSMTKAERKATVAKKVRGSKKGKQFVSVNEQMDIYDDVANMEFGMDYDQLGSNEKEWVRDEIDNMSIDEAMVNYDFSKKELIRVIKQLKRGASTEVGMIKAFEKALGRELTDDEIRGFKLNEVTRYSGFNRNPEDPDSVPFEPTGAVSEFKEELRALFGKFKGDLRNPEFIKGVAQIMNNWKPLLRSQLDEAKKKKAKKKDNRPIGKPMRDTSGGKAYKVYVKDPKTKKVKTVRFGSGGLRAKINDSKARKAFAARHKCSQKKDRTKASYWSCRLPRYAKLLGLKSSFSGFW